MQALARLVTEDDLAAGCIYPDVRSLRSISLQVARAVAQKVRYPPPGILRGVSEDMPVTAHSHQVQHCFCRTVVQRLQQNVCILGLRGDRSSRRCVCRPTRLTWPRSFRSPATS